MRGFGSSEKVAEVLKVGSVHSEKVVSYPINRPN